MKHLFLSGRRIDKPELLRALFTDSSDKDVLFEELKQKYEDGSIDRWLAAHQIEKGEENLLFKLCGYTPSPRQGHPHKHWAEHSDWAVKQKISRLRTTTWFREDLFPPGHDWYATVTCSQELEEIFNYMREADLENGIPDMVDIFICNVGESYTLHPRQIGGIRFIGFGEPVIRLHCNYHETLDLPCFRLIFEGIKLESTQPCFLEATDKEIRDCGIAENMQLNKRGNPL